MTADRTPQHPAAVYRLTLAATSPDPHERTACVPPARNVVRAVATGWGVTGTALDDLVAVAGELLANAALHAGPDLIHARILLDAGGNQLRIEVADRAAALPRAVTGPGDDREVTGRGLLIVQALADRWGADPTPAGKAVWAELDLPQPLDELAVAARARQENARADYTAAARMGTAPVRLPTSRRPPAGHPSGPQPSAHCMPGTVVRLRGPAPARPRLFPSRRQTSNPVQPPPRRRPDSTAQPSRPHVGFPQPGCPPGPPPPSLDPLQQPTVDRAREALPPRCRTGTAPRPTGRSSLGGRLSNGNRGGIRVCCEP
ncbi:ATP-binding protein [Kitasatospora sp. NPDC052868]|uniref:ATP-binding protein n=1 Tax=Kitasatospora sp. NPDC052868 TaxID=3364060 RepID=UPI0037C8F5A7